MPYGLPQSPAQFSSQINSVFQSNPWLAQFQSGLQPQLEAQAAPQFAGQDALGFGRDAIDTARQRANLNLFDPAVLAQLTNMLQPYFRQQTEGFTGAYNQQRQNLLGEAGRTAGAQAAARGFSPGSYVQSAQGRVNENLSPQYFGGLNQLLQQQLALPIDLTSQAQQFRGAGLMGLSGTQLSNAGLGLDYGRFLETIRQFNTQQANQPGFGDYLLSGLFGGLGAIGQGFGYKLGQGL
jgi:hypothetical protein